MPNADEPEPRNTPPVKKLKWLNNFSYGRSRRCKRIVDKRSGNIGSAHGGQKWTLPLYFDSSVSGAEAKIPQRLKTDCSRLLTIGYSWPISIIRAAKWVSNLLTLTNLPVNRRIAAIEIALNSKLPTMLLMVGRKLGGSCIVESQVKNPKWEKSSPRPGEFGGVVPVPGWLGLGIWVPSCNLSTHAFPACLCRLLLIDPGGGGAHDRMAAQGNGTAIG